MTEKIVCPYCGAEYTTEEITRYKKWRVIDGKRGFFCQDCREFVEVKG